MPIHFTPLMKKRLTRRVHTMLRTSLSLFPELHGKTITVGYTRSNLGVAVVLNHVKGEHELTIRLNARMLTYNTIGHELTHLVQGLSQLQKSEHRSASSDRIPGGEKQCDIWTLRRSSLFCDDPPTYLKLPRTVRENWPEYKNSVRDLCIMAIEKRKTYRLYIRWLESEIKQLARQPLRRSRGFRQLRLPFDT